MVWHGGGRSYDMRGRGLPCMSGNHISRPGVETLSSRVHRNLETVHLSIRGKMKNLVLSPNVADEITERKNVPSRTVLKEL